MKKNKANNSDRRAVIYSGIISVCVLFIAIASNMIIASHKSENNDTEVSTESTFEPIEESSNTFYTSDVEDPNNENYLCYVSNMDDLITNNVLSCAAIWKFEKELDTYMRDNGYKDQTEVSILTQTFNKNRNAPQFDFILVTYNKQIHATYDMINLKYIFS